MNAGYNLFMNSKPRKVFGPDILFVLLILINLVVGVKIVNDFGGGWDDVVEYERGKQSYSFYYDKEADESIYEPRQFRMRMTPGL